MTDDTHLATRRTALKGHAAFTGTSAVGAGAILHASDPASASGHLMTVDDITIGTHDGEVAELGISDLWFAVHWENIVDDLRVNFRFISNPNELTSYRDNALLHSFELGVNGTASETFGYGDEYESSYSVDLNGAAYLDGAAPLYASAESPNGEAFLEELNLNEDQEETTETVGFEVGFTHVLEETSEFLDSTRAEFDVTIQRVEGEVAVDDGEADAYGRSALDTPTPAGEPIETPGQPGFGVASTLLALLVAGRLSLRRRA